MMRVHARLLRGLQGEGKCFARRDTGYFSCVAYVGSLPLDWWWRMEEENV